MNQAVVAVKVDREEHPDVDAVFMEAVLAATGSGGWPMSVFATPSGKPFFAGTYFPATPHHGLPSFRQVLSAVSDAWKSRRLDVEAQAARLSDVVVSRLSVLSAREENADGVSRSRVVSATEKACARLVEGSDQVHGGFGDAPKFPQPLLLDLLLRSSESAEPDSKSSAGRFVERTLEAMACGGIYDQIGGGFSRYSVDRSWTVPHFEKMLYDQALLSRVYLHAWQLTRDSRWRVVVDEVLEYTLTRLHHRSGALCSAEDADSEGEEGRYYVWRYEDFIEAVGPELAEEAVAWYGVSRAGNFEEVNVLTAPPPGFPRPQGVTEARRRLAARREKRVRPALDDKVLTEWNAMASAVLAEAAGALDSSRYAEASDEIVSVLLEARRRNGGITPRSVVEGDERPRPGYAGDVAWLLEACLRMYELTGHPHHLSSARDLADELLARFIDENGIVFTAAKDGSALTFTRWSENADGVIPSAASVSARALARLGWILDETPFLQAAERIVLAATPLLFDAPTAFPELLWAADLLSAGPVEIVAPSASPDVVRKLQREFLPSALYVWTRDDVEDQPSSDLPLLAGREPGVIYVCTDGTCRLPTEAVDETLREINQAVAGRSQRGRAL